MSCCVICLVEVYKRYVLHHITKKSETLKYV